MNPRHRLDGVVSKRRDEFEVTHPRSTHPRRPMPSLDTLDSWKVSPRTSDVKETDREATHPPSMERTPSAFSFEETFETADAGIAGAIDRLSVALRALAGAKKAALTGDVSALSKAIHAARAAVGESEPQLEQVAIAVAHDFASAMRSNELTREIVARAATAHLPGVRLVHGVVFSFPVMLTPLPERLAVRIGKKLIRCLRPSTLIRLLESQRDRKPSRRYLERVLMAIEEAYLDASGQKLSIAVKIGDIHHQLTRLPEQKNAYPELDFISDLYLLEREGVLQTPIGHVVSFPASTGTRGGNAIRITTESGQERVYSSIRFD